MWRCNQLFCRHRAEEKWMNVKMVEQWSGIQRNLPAVYVRKDTKERSVKKVIKILINMKTYICDLKVYIYACILQAHSHSHSKSGGSIWASLECQCCFWIPGGLVSYLTMLLLTIQLFKNSIDTKGKLRLNLRIQALVPHYNEVTVQS